MDMKVSDLTSVTQAMSALGTTNSTVAGLINSLSTESSATGTDTSAISTFSTLLQKSIEQMTDNGTIDEDAATELVSAIDTAAAAAKSSSEALDSTQEDNTYYQLYRELLSSSTGRANIQDIAADSLTGIIFDTDSSSAGIDNFNSLLGALGSIEISDTLKKLNSEK